MDHAKERNAKDKVLSVNVGWQLEARTVVVASATATVK
jgi:hypothetical protein